MDPTSSESTTLARTSEGSLDAELLRMAHLPMGQVVHRTEFDIPRIVDFASGKQNAQSHLVAQMYTDAIFNGDIRGIQTIIARIDWCSPARIGSILNGRGKTSPASGGRRRRGRW